MTTANDEVERRKEVKRQLREAHLKEISAERRELIEEAMNSIDRYIELKQVEMDALQKYRDGLIQQLFPKDLW